MGVVWLRWVSARVFGIFALVYLRLMDTDAQKRKVSAVRSAICDMSLLIFHLVLSTFTFVSVDVRKAARILEWDLKWYPNGACMCQIGCVLTCNLSLFDVPSLQPTHDRRLLPLRRRSLCATTTSSTR